MKNLQEMTKTEKRMLALKTILTFLVLLSGSLLIVGTYLYLVFGSLGALFTGQFIKALAMAAGVYVWHYVSNVLYALAQPMINFIKTTEMTIKISKM